MAEQPLRVVLVDDHEVVRNGAGLGLVRDHLSWGSSPPGLCLVDASDERWAIYESTDLGDHERVRLAAGAGG